MKKEIIWISLIGLLLFAGLVAAIRFLSTGAESDTGAMSVANQLHSTGQYQEAAQVYEQLLAGGMTDSSLYYNLANTYLEQGDIGRAVLNYQRAARLDPRDADIQANLAYARSLSTETYENGASGPIQSFSGFTSSWLTLNETAVSALAIWFVLCFLMLALRVIHSGRIRSVIQYGIVLVTLLFVVAGFSLASRMYIERTQPGGVIVAPEVALSSSPGIEFVTEFRLFSGTEVRVSGTQGDWAHLTVHNEALDGWIPLDTVETISGNIAGGIVKLQS